jgi:hypothetical protein
LLHELVPALARLDCTGSTVEAGGGSGEGWSSFATSDTFGSSDAGGASRTAAQFAALFTRPSDPRSGSCAARGASGGGAGVGVAVEPSAIES